MHRVWIASLGFDLYLGKKSQGKKEERKGERALNDEIELKELIRLGFESKVAEKRKETRG